MGTASNRSLLSGRKARRDERNAQRLAGMYPTGDEAQKQRLELAREIQGLQPPPLAVKVTATTRWG